jgi:hypothetical protein
VRLEQLYRLSFRYHEAWTVRLGDEVHQLLHGEGRCEGRINGNFRGTNRARRRSGAGPFEPDYHGVIETDDGAAILWALSGYGLPDENRAVVAIKHLSEDERYGWLNDRLCAGSATLIRDPDGETEVILDVAELVWEPAP